MKVVFVAPFGLQKKTTVWARTLPLAQALRARGYEATILIPPWDSAEDSGSIYDEGGVRLVNLPLGGGTPGLAGRLWRQTLALQPDIVHIVKPRAHAGLVQWALWNSRSQRRRPLLLLDADDWEQAWAAVNPYSPAVARFLAWQEEWGLRHADGFTVASRWLQRRVQDYSPNCACLYLPNGVTLPATETQRSAGAGATVLYFTRYAEVTPAWLAEFAGALAQEAPGSRLLVAGAPLLPTADRPFREAIARLYDRGVASRSALESPASDNQRLSAPEADSLHESALTSRSNEPASAANCPQIPLIVDFLGAVPSADLAILYSRSTVAIFPARPEPLQQAKCSVRLATTLLNGVPVVASTVGEQQNYGADGAAMLLPADATPAAFAHAVAGLLADAPARKAMVTRARGHLAAHYQWSDLAARLAAFYADTHRAYHEKRR